MLIVVVKTERRDVSRAAYPTVTMEEDEALSLYCRSASNQRVHFLCEQITGLFWFNSIALSREVGGVVEKDLPA